MPAAKPPTRMLRSAMQWTRSAFSRRRIAARSPVFRPVVIGFRLRRSASKGMTLAPVASIASRCARTRVTTVTSSPSSRAALAMGRKWEAKNQSSVTMKTSLRPLTSGRGKEDKG